MNTIINIILMPSTMLSYCELMPITRMSSMKREATVKSVINNWKYILSIITLTFLRIYERGLTFYYKMMLSVSTHYLLERLLFFKALEFCALLHSCLNHVMSHSKLLHLPLAALLTFVKL